VTGYPHPRVFFVRVANKGVRLDAAARRAAMIGGRMTGIGIRMTEIGLERVEAAGAVRCVAWLGGKHEGFYHEIGEDVK
jgi:hypothetical protein